MSGPSPEPHVMPIDRERWRREIHLSNFVNAACEYRDLQACGSIRNVLTVGPGQGLDTQVLKWLGYHVTTLDIDATFDPDHVGSVHEMTVFGDGSFDAVIASHVLEHLPEPYLDRALREIARVGRYALVYLPIAGRHVQARLFPGFGRRDFCLSADIFNYFERPDGVTARYMGGQHYWEVGLRGFRVRDLVARLSRHFAVMRKYRNRDWLGSQNFVLLSKQHAARL